MVDRTMTSMLLFNSKASELPMKSGASGLKQMDDSFAGVFQEKMNDYSKPAKRTVRQPVDRSPETETPKAASDDKAKAAAYKVKPEENREVKNNVEKTADNTGDRDSEKAKGIEDEESLDALNMLASLLENLMGKLDELLEKAMQEPEKLCLEGESDVNPFELLKALLAGKADELQKLIGKLGAQNNNPETSGFIKELKSLLEELNQIKEGGVDLSKLDLKLELEAEGNIDEAGKALIMKLKALGSEVLERVRQRISELTENGEADPAQDDMILTPEISDDMSKKDSEQKSGNEKEESQSSTDTAPGKIVAAPQSDLQDNQGNNTDLNEDQFVIPQNTKVDAGSEAKAVKSEFHLSEKPLSQSVTNQVVMRVKLMSGQNRQEMEMHLKPESLGKLTLKIIHERGEVLAKITAENEQVKSILESNMQLLKDSLEKNGLSLQSLSVSVGNGNGEQNQKDQESRSQKDSLNQGAMKIGGITRENPGSRSFKAQGMRMDSSSIDLTA